MPIQFRCGSCNQLLGIASRKAGHVVNCPTCGNKTVVPRVNGVVVKAALPQPQPALAHAAGAPTPGLPAPEVQAPVYPAGQAEPEEPVGLSLLDRVDIDALLAPPKEGQPVATLPGEGPARREPPPPPAAEEKRRKRDLEFTAMPPMAEEDMLSLPELETPASPHLTLVLTPTLAAVLVVLFIALLAGVLLLGMWLGSRFTA
jgi:phage FluMu protein Com